MQNKGFTLIELLVVISIIGILSAIVLTALTEARQRAQNTAIITQINQYLTVLEMYQLENGGYPYTPLGDWYCLGDDPDDNGCWNNNNVDESTDLIDELKPYYEAMPIGGSVDADPGPIQGYIYRCLVDSGSYCTSISLLWALEGEYANCSPGFSVDDTWGGATRCRFNQAL